ncbi:MAG: HlyD family type I secretion periplasmic adaptor subunit [Rhodospirillales bacterium]|nr:HlyD family type I secretion periplasmic adaptor subunit [Rhodospirillales bacterium]
MADATPLPQSTSRALAAMASANDPASRALLEFESPTMSLIARPIRVGIRYTTWTLAIAMAALVVIAGTVPIDRVVTTHGRVVPRTHNIVVQPLETAIIRSIDVREGQFVKKGQLLAQLDPTFVQADEASLAQRVASLGAEVARLRAEASGRVYLSDGTTAGNLEAEIFTQRHAEYTFKVQTYDQRIASAKAKVEQAAADITSFTQRLAVARDVERKRIELERLQVGSQLNTLAAQDNRVEMERSLADAQAQAAGASRDLSALRAERDAYIQQFKADISSQLQTQTRKLVQAREDLNKARLRRQLVQLRADRDAVVLSVAPVSVGSVLQSGDEFITLVPADAKLEIETVMSGNDAGFVHVGQPVRIKFDSFPYYTYGTAYGTVRVISPDSFHAPNVISGVVTRPHSTQPFGQVYYRVRMTIDQMHMRNLPPGFRLAPGMPVTADIKIGKRTALQFMLSQVIPATTQGMREP